jgi:hypothetical protein
VYASKLSFGNPRWEGALETVVAKACAKLGATGGVRAELYNLLVYTEGGHFARHRDSEKAEGMFGTLVVVLPSYHEGGSLVERHGGEELSCACEGETGLLEPRTCAFYADCEHELERVSAGRRLALIYNLCRNLGAHGPGRQPPSQAGAARAFGALAERSADGDFRDPPPKLCWFLEHQYSQDGLGWEALKGADECVASALRRCRAPARPRDPRTRRASSPLTSEAKPMLRALRTLS